MKKNISYNDALGFTPSEYQEKIFDFIVHGHGNCVINARAGSGKTQTMIACMKLLPSNKECLFLAFNKSVKEEIKTKLQNYNNCKIHTVHGLGYGILSNYLKKINIDDFKYIAYLRNNMEVLSTADVHGKQAYNQYVDRIIEILSLARMDLSQSKREIQKSAAAHNIEIKYDEDCVVKQLMDWGKQELSTVDYTDLVWLPNELILDARGNKYDWIFNDEAQDYSIAYVNLFQKCFKRGTRFVACGDEFQSINQFAGASKEAFNMMVNHRNTVSFDLPISYRCDKNIIETAQQFVPDIKATETAEDGIIINESHINDISNDDMVLSRTNAPLLKLYSKLIKLGKPCYIKGQDNDKNRFINIINNYDVNDNLGEAFKNDGLFPRLYKAMVIERNGLVENGVNIIDAIHSPSVQYFYDLIVSLSVIANGCTTVNDMREKINKIYSQSCNGICLSTIHKAKGLEADNVHILNRSDMPNKYAKTATEIQAERNLLYVAITRARHKLAYISEKEFPPMKIIDNSNNDVDEFNYIEASVCKLYNLSPIQPIKNVDISKLKLKTATQIGKHHIHDNKKTITIKNNKKTDLLSNLQ